MEHSRLTEIVKVVGRVFGGKEEKTKKKGRIKIGI